MAILAGAPTKKLPTALENFKGVKRRFSYKIKTQKRVLIDDYAHHPTEIDALFQAVTELYPNEKKLIVFQPHLYSRTQDFVAGFARSLSQFDEVLLLDIYPAREKPRKGITSSWLLEKIKTKKKLITKTQIAASLLDSKTRIQLLVGAGDIGEEVATVTKIIQDNE